MLRNIIVLAIFSTFLFIGTESNGNLDAKIEGDSESTYKSKATAPNIIVIVADDLGWNDVSFHGSPQIPTPNIDAWAADGVKLSNYYAMHLCTPSRAALLTSRYPIRYGLQHRVILAGQRLAIPLNETLFPQYLTEEFLDGITYDSHIVGKWHLGFFNKQYTPTQRGFQTFFGYYCAKNDYYDHRACEGMPGWCALDWHRDTHDEYQHIDSDYGQYATDLMADEAAKIIKTHAANMNSQERGQVNPLFLYLALQAVHGGNLHDDTLQAPHDAIYRNKEIWFHHRRKYAGMVSSMDDAIGRVRETLRLTGMDKNTIVLFTSDNGGPPNGLNNNYASNWPLRSSKYTLYEGGLRVVGFIAGPNLPADTIANQLIHVVDWIPTLFEAAGGDVSKLPSTLDGVSQWSNLVGAEKNEGPRNEILLNIDPLYQAAGIRMGDYKLLLNPDNGLQGYDGWFQASGALPDTNASIVIDASNPTQVVCSNLPDNPSPCVSNLRNQSFPICLFNIREDPCEIDNLAEEPECRDTIHELALRLRQYWREMVPANNAPIDPTANPCKRGYKWAPWTEDPTISISHLVPGDDEILTQIIEGT